jgi:hypothetical protein
MNCTRTEKFLPLHVAGDLAGRRARAVERHLAACARCRRAAAEYRASRELFSATTLAPDFDGAFYEEIRNSVLARIRHDRTLAPPAPRGFAGLFNMRFALAASLALLFIAAALAFHGYAPRTSESGAGRKMIAAVNDGGAATRPPVPATPPSKTNTPPSVPAGKDARAASRTPEEFAGATWRASAGRASKQRALKSSLSKPEAYSGSARNEASPRLASKQPPPAHARLNPHALDVAAASARANAGEIGDRGASGRAFAAAPAAPEVSRIEIQTSDPNIRIIWLSPGTEDTARPLK